MVGHAEIIDGSVDILDIGIQPIEIWPEFDLPDIKMLNSAAIEKLNRLWEKYKSERIRGNVPFDVPSKWYHRTTTNPYEVHWPKDFENITYGFYIARVALEKALRKYFQIERIPISHTYLKDYDKNIIRREILFVDSDENEIERAYEFSVPLLRKPC